MDDGRAPTAGDETAEMPVTVIGGYLGAGKTTLVNHILRTGGERIAVLVNDFGDIDIDSDLIERDDGDTIALANGCICCSLVDGLATALATIRQLEPPPDRLVIEASGVADPASVAAYGHGPGMALDAVIVVADAETVRSRAADKYVGDTVTRQLRSADVVVLNKVDLVDPDEVVALRRWIEPHIDGAPIVDATESRVDPAVLFGRANPWPDRGSTVATASGHPVHHRADSVYASWSWAAGTDALVDPARVEALMDALPESVVRAKGVLWLAGDDGPQRHVLQRVGSRWSLRRVKGGGGGGSERSRLVVIGLRDAITQKWLDARMGG